jgi:type II secretory pathway component PulC
VRKLLSAGWVLVALPLFLPGSAVGQTSQDPLRGEVSDSILGYEREVFEYPAAGRRNPFRPLTVFDTGGPRFADLELTGIVYSPHVGSVVVVADRTNERRYRLREGERVGTARVLEIRPDEVVFGITTFGSTRQAILRAKKERGQGE